MPQSAVDRPHINVYVNIHWLRSTEEDAPGTWGGAR